MLSGDTVNGNREAGGSGGVGSATGSGVDDRRDDEAALFVRRVDLRTTTIDDDEKTSANEQIRDIDDR